MSVLNDSVLAKIDEALATRRAELADAEKAISNVKALRETIRSLERARAALAPAAEKSTRKPRAARGLAEQAVAAIDSFEPLSRDQALEAAAAWCVARGEVVPSRRALARAYAARERELAELVPQDESVAATAG